MKNKFDPTENCLVPKHEKLTEKDKKDLLEKYGITLKELPKILSTDAAIQGLKLKEGDIVKITRPSPTIGEAVFYRSVING